jgi:hypothetical protein
MNCPYGAFYCVSPMFNLCLIPIAIKHKLLIFEGQRINEAIEYRYTLTIAG